MDLLKKIVYPSVCQDSEMCLEKYRARKCFNFGLKATPVNESQLYENIVKEFDRKLSEHKTLITLELEQEFDKKLSDQKRLITLELEQEFDKKLSDQKRLMALELERLIDNLSMNISENRQIIDATERKTAELEKRLEESLSNLSELQKELFNLNVNKEKGPNFFTNQTSNNIYQMFDGTIYNRNCTQQPDSIIASATKGDSTRMFSTTSPLVSSAPRSAHYRGPQKLLLNKEEPVPLLANLMEESENSSNNMTPKNDSIMSICSSDSFANYKIAEDVPKEHLESKPVEKPKPVGLHAREPLKEMPVVEVKHDTESTKSAPVSAPFEIYQSFHKTEEDQIRINRLAESPFVKPKRMKVESQRKALCEVVQPDYTKLQPGLFSPAVPVLRAPPVDPPSQIKTTSESTPETNVEPAHDAVSATSYDSGQTEQTISYENQSGQSASHHLKSVDKTGPDTLTGKVSTVLKQPVRTPSQTLWDVPPPVDVKKPNSGGDNLQEEFFALDFDVESTFHPLISSTQNVGNLLRKFAQVAKPNEHLDDDQFFDDNDYFDKNLQHNRMSLLPKIEPPRQGDISLLINNLGISCEEQYPWQPTLLRKLWEDIQPLFAGFKNIEMVVFDFYCKIKPRSSITIQEQEYLIEKILANGAYGEIFLAKDKYANKNVVLKLQKNELPLEYFYMMECKRKLELAAKNNRPDFSLCVTSVIHFMLHPSSLESIIVMPYYGLGSLLDIINCGPLCRLQREMLSGYICLELLHLIYQLHTEVRILHADIKPDNIFIRAPMPYINSGEKSHLVGNCGQMICLGDFGRSIYLKFFSDDVCFRGKESADGFECAEMVTDSPWKYQIDLFGVAAVVYAMIFRKYMKLSFNSTKECWEPESMTGSSRLFKLHYFWNMLFSKLLNVKSCSQNDYPDLPYLINQCDKALRYFDSSWNKNVDIINKTLGFQ